MYVDKLGENFLDSPYIQWQYRVTGLFEVRIMTREFLSFVDEATQFGKLFISADRLFEIFVEKKKLGPNHAYGFRIRLQKQGIL
jgi:hypothetical protein